MARTVTLPAASVTVVVAPVANHPQGILDHGWAFVEGAVLGDLPVAEIVEIHGQGTLPAALGMLGIAIDGCAAPSAPPVLASLLVISDLPSGCGDPLSYQAAVEDQGHALIWAAPGDWYPLTVRWPERLVDAARRAAAGVPLDLELVSDGPAEIAGCLDSAPARWHAGDCARISALGPWTLYEAERVIATGDGGAP